MKKIVQVKNPRSGRYVKIDLESGMILAHKKSEGPYKGIKQFSKKKKRK